MTKLLEAHQLVKVFKGAFKKDRVKALDCVNLSVQKGEIFGLLGPNGSGKTTLIKVFLGLVAPTSGVATILNCKPGALECRRKVGYLPEESYLYRFLTPEESLVFYGQMAGIHKDLIKQRIPEILQQVELFDARKRLVATFSKGMLRRLGLSFILVKDPEVIFLDEPTSGLDPLGALKVREMMLRLKERGKTIVMSSHLLGEIENVCDRVAILYRGRILKEDALDNILSVRDEWSFVLKNQTPDVIRRLKGMFESQGIEIAREGHPKKTLDQAFLEILNH